MQLYSTTEQASHETLLANAGGQAETEGLILACGERVKALAWRFARAYSLDVDDLYSTGMVAVCEAAPRVSADAARRDPFGYLYQAAKYAMIDECRRVPGSTTVSLDAPLSADSDLCLADVLPAPAPAPRRSRAAGKRARALYAALGRLSSERQRAAVQHRAGLPGYGQHTVKETAQIVGGPSTGAVHALSRHGRRALARDAHLRAAMGFGLDEGEVRA